MEDVQYQWGFGTNNPITISPGVYIVSGISLHYITSVKQTGPKE